MNKKKLGALLILLFIALSAFFHSPEKITPRLSYAIPEFLLKQKPYPFSDLSPEEKASPFGSQFQIARGFAKELELYQAINAYKSASFLASPIRALEMDYQALYGYFLARKYDDVIFLFENSPLRFVDNTFTPYHDLLIILFETYFQTHKEIAAAQILNLIQSSFPQSYDKLIIWQAFEQADLTTIAKHLPNFVTQYESSRKSPLTTELLNTVLPGAGYAYLGQYQSAITSFLLNGLFIGSTYRFFAKGYIAATVIFGSFESGWYYGGVFGGGLETSTYNSILYSRLGRTQLGSGSFFPLQMLQYGL